MNFVKEAQISLSTAVGLENDPNNPGILEYGVLTHCARIVPHNEKYYPGNEI
jgi:uncharacterized protein YuzB (UPF0349 family)